MAQFRTIIYWDTVYDSVVVSREQLVPSNRNPDGSWLCFSFNLILDNITIDAALLFARDNDPSKEWDGVFTFDN